MTLNLAQVRQQIKSATLSRAALNLATGSGQSAAYRALKDLGWTSAMEVHPTDRVPVFRLNGAALRRDRSDRTGWILEVGEDTYAVRTTALDDLTELTERATAMTAPAAAALTDAPRIALDLLAQHPQLDGWAQRGLALVESGDFDAGKYDTRIVIETGHYECDCPARAPRLNLENRLQIETFLNGKACKHTIALYLQTALDHEAETVAYRERFERRERRRGSVPADAPLTRDERFELDDLRRSDNDLAGFDEWFERNEQRRHRPDADPRDHYSDSGWDLNDPTPAVSVAEDIKRMLGQNEPVEEWKPTEADKQRAFKKMIKNQPRQTGIGSMPAAWRTR